MRDTMDREDYADGGNYFLRMEQRKLENQGKWEQITKKWCERGVNYARDCAILFIQVKIGVDSYFYDTSMKIEVKN